MHIRCYLIIRFTESSSIITKQLFSAHSARLFLCQILCPGKQHMALSKARGASWATSADNCIFITDSSLRNSESQDLLCSRTAIHSGFRPEPVLIKLFSFSPQLPIAHFSKQVIVVEIQLLSYSETSSYLLFQGVSSQFINSAV